MYQTNLNIACSKTCQSNHLFYENKRNENCYAQEGHKDFTIIFWFYAPETSKVSV